MRLTSKAPVQFSSCMSAERLELVLTFPSGDAWRLSMSPPSARFVGPYQRIPGLGGPDGLLQWERSGLGAVGSGPTHR
jgi:hypothetical protein